MTADGDSGALVRGLALAAAFGLGFLTCSLAVTVGASALFVVVSIGIGVLAGRLTYVLLSLNGTPGPDRGEPDSPSASPGASTNLAAERRVLRWPDPVPPGSREPGADT